MPHPDFETVKELVETGDIDLADYRAKFMVAYGRATTATDDQIIDTIARVEIDDEMQGDTLDALFKSW
jgi:hypothetical protein